MAMSLDNGKVLINDSGTRVERGKSEMGTTNTYVTTIPYQQGDPATEEAVKLFALYLQGITVVPISK